MGVKALVVMSVNCSQAGSISNQEKKAQLFGSCAPIAELIMLNVSTHTHKKNW